ncbi:MAG: D-alanyl-lipoteichoic acid biosynthesis protein DltD [Streptococcus mitis]|uniref:D-alanyl-lipoteichoic acid biosynthesis protein DltD n=1 Tax=Streptococcus mitis TaxID=28037 RepID=UPI00398C17A7|nr:D-alanyl-lipoteichoic acid biosynthesis protein DltD [Streptococcus mitis]
MLKRLWMIFGPVLIAGLLVFLLIFFYPTSKSYNLSQEKRYAAAISTQSFRERFQKVRALSDPSLRFIPFFGSSEWIRFDSMHPAVLAEKYNRSYRPYFLGQAGAASLNQYFGMQQILPEIENKQAVFVISPQWFTETEYEPAVFRRYFNTDQLGAFLENQSGDVSSRYAAKRLMTKYPDVVLGDIVKKITEGEQLSEIDQTLIDTLARFNQKQSFLFGQLSVNDGEKYRDRVEKYLKDLPDKFSYDALREIAVKDAEANTTNNDMGMENHFYDTQVKKDLKKWKDYQKNYNFLKSSEYNDLQLVLNQFANSKVNVLFVIQPVNKKWIDYTGLNQDMYQHAVEKIRYQLESQGFTNIADFSKNGAEPYFVKDTIHIGWLGWLAFDKAVDPFLSNPTPAPTYHLNERFFSKDWATYDGDVKEFQ